MWKSADGAIHEFRQFNDRGRGPKIYSTYRVDEQGLIVFEESKGLDYMRFTQYRGINGVRRMIAWKGFVQAPPGTANGQLRTRIPCCCANHHQVFSSVKRYDSD